MNENIVSLSPFLAPRKVLAVLEAVVLRILCMAKIKSLPSQQLLLSRSRQYSPNTHGQQESTAPAQDGPRQERNQNDPSRTPEQQQRSSHHSLAA
jgi:hypothetical protein